MAPGGTTNRLSPVRAMIAITVIVMVMIIAGIVALVRSIGTNKTNSTTKAGAASSTTNTTRSTTPVPKESRDATNRVGTLAARADGTLTLRAQMYDEGTNAYVPRDVTVRVSDGTIITEDDRRAMAIPVPGQKTIQRTPRFIEQNSLAVGDTLQVFTATPVFGRTEIDATEVRRLLLPTAKK